MMRLTCPNCAAQYEVPEDVIPAEGRDVQCSNCGQTWFQAAAGTAASDGDTGAETDAGTDSSTGAHLGPDAAPDTGAVPAEPATAASPAPAPSATPESNPTETDLPSDTVAPAAGADAETNTQADDLPATKHAPDLEPDAAEDDRADVTEDKVQASATPQRSRGLDPALTEILREEAEREAALRAQESQSIETQPDLGLQEPRRPPQATDLSTDDTDATTQVDASQRGREARDRMARLRGEDPRLAAAAETGKRRELLPDIEEINSTLRASGAGGAAATAQPDTTTPPARRRNSFARGFTFSVVTGLLLLLVYDKAPLIANTLPPMESALNSYVGWVDQARLWLDAQVQGATTP